MRIHIRSYFSIVGLLVIWSCSYNSFEDKEQVDCNISDLSVSLLQVIETDCGLDNGSIRVVANGGLSPYGFSLDDGPSQLDSLFRNLGAANYIVTVMDSNGCFQELEATVQNKDGVSASFSVVDSECGENIGSISIEATNGVEPYIYQLNEGPPQSSNIFTGLGSGIYKVKVTDADGCNLILEDRVSSGVSFSTSISNIISQNCAVSNCHAGSQSPDFRQFSNIQSNASRIRILTQNGSMPQNGSLTKQEIDLIACWVDDGALNN